MAVDQPAWLADHRLAGTVVFPGSGYIEMVLAAPRRRRRRRRRRVESLAIREALVLPEDGAVTVQTVVTAGPNGDARGPDPEPRSVRGGRRRGLDAPRPGHHCAAAPPGRRPTPVVVDDLVDGFGDEIDVADYYRRLDEIGLTYGPAFQGLTRLRRRDGAAIGLAALPAEVADGASYGLHPALLDACFHVLGAAIASPADGWRRPLRAGRCRGPAPVPARCDRACGAPSPSSTARPTATRSISARLELYGLDGAAVATVDRLEVRRTSRSLWQREAAVADGPLYELGVVGPGGATNRRRRP